MDLCLDLYVGLVDHLQKTRKEYKNLRKHVIHEYIYQNKLDKACFQHGMPQGDFKDLSRRTASDKMLHDKAFNIAKHPKYDGYCRGLTSVVYNFFDKKTSCVAIQNENIWNEESAEELHKLIIKKLKNRKVQSSFEDNIWGEDLADMFLISNFDKAIRFILCVVDIFS